jgi:hypothetical protein
VSSDDEAWTEYDAVRSAAWDRYLAFRGPVFRYNGTETRTWNEFCQRSAVGLSEYLPVWEAAWAKYVARRRALMK